MDAAERLFAERGIDAVSLRTVNAKAGYSAAALHYHFGSRDGLIQALFERAQPSMIACCKRMLDELHTYADPPLERIVEALVRPLSAGLTGEITGGDYRLRFLMRLYFDRSPYMARMHQQSLEAFLPLLRRALPRLDDRTLQQRWVLAGELAGYALTNVTQLHLDGDVRGRLGSSRLEAFLSGLIEFITGGLCAPH